MTYLSPVVSDIINFFFLFPSLEGGVGEGERNE